MKIKDKLGLLALVVVALVTYFAWKHNRDHDSIYIPEPPFLKPSSYPEGFSGTPFNELFLRASRYASDPGDVVKAEYTFVTTPRIGFNFGITDRHKVISIAAGDHVSTIILQTDMDTAVRKQVQVENYMEFPNRYNEYLF